MQNKDSEADRISSSFRMTLNHLLLYFTGILISGSSSAIEIQTKVWYGNTNFHNPHNWRPMHIPCANSRVIFDSLTQDLVVLISPIQTTVKEMILPFNGALVFPTNGALMFNSMNSIKITCKNEDVHYVGTTITSWLDPKNWGQEGENPDLLRNTPIPHTEQIPCQHDKVIFPSGSSFKVVLPMVSTAIGSLNIQGQALDIEGWRMLTESNIGKRQFIGDPNVITILGDDGTDHPCTKPTGCYCGNSGPVTMERVCSYAGGSKCELPLCLHPIQPIGHCCDICGAIIQFEFNPQTFKMSAVQNHVKRFTSSSVLGHVSKTSATSNTVQIVFVDSGAYQGRSVNSAEKLLKILKNDMSLGVSDIKFQESGAALDLSEMYIGHSPEKIAGFIFGGCALLIIVFLLILAYKDARFKRSETPSFVFSRFENLSSRREGPVVRVWGEEVAEEVLEEEERELDRPKEQSGWISMDSVLVPSKPQAFDNPMYDKPVIGDDGKKLDASKHQSGTRKVGKKAEPSHDTTMENPVYSALKEASMEGEQAQQEAEERREPPPAPITRRKARSKAAKKGKAKREILSEDDTDDSAQSDALTAVEDLD